MFPIFLASEASLENRNPAYGGGVAEWLKAALLLPVFLTNRMSLENSSPAKGGEKHKQSGGVREWLKRTVLKTVMPAMAS